MSTRLPDLSAGSCWGATDDAVWYPRLHGGAIPALIDPAAEARRVCSTCPVLATCREWALDLPERYGVWGGLDPPQRANIRRQQRRKSNA